SAEASRYKPGSRDALAERTWLDVTPRWAECQTIPGSQGSQRSTREEPRCRADERDDHHRPDREADEVLAKRPPQALRPTTPQAQRVDEQQGPGWRVRLIARRLQTVEEGSDARRRLRRRREADHDQRESSRGERGEEDIRIPLIQTLPGD